MKIPGFSFGEKEGVERSANIEGEQREFREAQEATGLFILFSKGENGISVELCGTGTEPATMRVEYDTSGEHQAGILFTEACQQLKSCASKGREEAQRIMRAYFQRRQENLAA